MNRRRSAWRFALAAVLAFFLVACASGQDRAPAAGTRASEESEAVASSNQRVPLYAFVKYWLAGSAFLISFCCFSAGSSDDHCDACWLKMPCGESAGSVP